MKSKFRRRARERIKNFFKKSKRVSIDIKLTEAEKRYLNDRLRWEQESKESIKNIRLRGE